MGSADNCTGWTFDDSRWDHWVLGWRGGRHARPRAVKSGPPSPRWCLAQAIGSILVTRNSEHHLCSHPHIRPLCSSSQHLTRLEFNKGAQKIHSITLFHSFLSSLCPSLLLISVDTNILHPQHPNWSSCFCNFLPKEFSTQKPEWSFLNPPYFESFHGSPQTSG